ncbi:MAG: hypothetical protein Q9166_005303 [cf. Caloplaca sp. 2 TL-2023]
MSLPEYPLSALSIINLNAPHDLSSWKTLNEDGYELMDRDYWLIGWMMIIGEEKYIAHVLQRTHIIDKIERVPMVWNEFEVTFNDKSPRLISQDQINEILDKMENEENHQGRDAHRFWTAYKSDNSAGLPVPPLSREEFNLITKAAGVLLEYPNENVVRVKGDYEQRSFPAISMA